MNYNSLIYYALSFSAVVKAGGFSSAAKTTGVSKAQISRHVSALEAMLGIKLLHRTTRTMSLTEHGKQFFSAYEGIEERCLDAVNHLKLDFKNMYGTVKLTAPIDFGIQFLPPIIDAFSKEYPNLNVILSLSNTYENLNESNFDLAIRITNKLPDSDYRAKVLKKFKRIICASPKYFKNKTKPSHPNELKDYHCITSLNTSTDNIYPQWQFYKNNKPQNYKLEKFIQVDSTYAQIALIKSGAGIGRLPDYFIQNELKSGELIELFPTLERPVTYVYLLYSSASTLPKKTQILIDFISERIKK
jgi:DNA-binding transcriptional LysR family regulator